jgi:hypothetical protein
MAVKQLLQHQNKSLQDVSLLEMDAIWNDIKTKRRFNVHILANEKRCKYRVCQIVFLKDKYLSFILLRYYYLPSPFLQEETPSPQTTQATKLQLQIIRNQASLKKLFKVPML